MTFYELMTKCTTFDTVSIDFVKVFVKFDDEVNISLGTIVEDSNKGVWGDKNTYLFKKWGPGFRLFDEFEVEAISIENEHTLGVVVKR